MNAWNAASSSLSRTSVRAACLRWSFLAAGLLCMGAVTAQEGTAEDAPARPAPQPDKNGKICQYEDVTGSRMKKRICMTPEQYEARQRAAREAVRELDARSIPKVGEG